MKVTNIENSGLHFTIILIPNFIEKLFGAKQKQVCYKDTEREYRMGGGGVYIDSNGRKLPPSNYIVKALDLFRDLLYFKEK